jgi:hypothetical protein
MQLISITLQSSSILVRRMKTINWMQPCKIKELVPSERRARNVIGKIRINVHDGQSDALRFIDYLQNDAELPRSETPFVAHRRIIT